MVCVITHELILETMHALASEGWPAPSVHDIYKHIYAEFRANGFVEPRATYQIRRLRTWECSRIRTRLKTLEKRGLVKRTLYQHWGRKLASYSVNDPRDIIMKRLTSTLNPDTI